MASLVLASPAAAAPSLVKVGEFDRPVRVSAPPGDARLFVVEQHTGRVEIADPDGTVRSQPFLDVGGEIAKGHEQGLLSIAFAPDYEASGFLYAYLTPPGKVEIREYRRGADDPYRAVATGRTIFSAAHPRSNHNGGLVVFGPDGQLWFGTGDGGGANDPDNNGQNTATPLGKLHRLEPAGFTPAQGNPFGSVFAYGLRNPWRFSFDRQTGDLVIADVGQGAREEVDFAAAPGRGNGANYGWKCYEGSIPTPGVACPAPPANHTPPVHELTHEGGACSITGGVVVRDPGVPSLSGRYLYGDVCKSELRSVTLPSARDDRAENALRIAQVVDIAEDPCGRVLVSSLDGGVYRLVEGAPSQCSLTVPATQTVPASPTAPASPTCGLGVRAFGARAATVRRTGLLVRASVRDACRVSATARLAGGGTLVARGREMAAGARASLRLRAGRKTRARLRRTLRRRRSVLATVTVTARPAGGTPERQVRRVRIRR